ncbi:MAG TPA: hypothetical protein VH680_01120 [Gemmatimonadales bacterium]|jgi:hypothetical protein
MRNYWLKILLGALGIFVLGMIGVTIVRSGIAKVNSVVEGSGPITIPLGLIPFVLGGERLGNLDRVTLHRESPSRVDQVELQVDLADSLLAHGLSGCRLAANFEDGGKGGVDVRVGRDQNHTFECVREDSTPPNMIEYGTAIFRPGDVEVPLLLPADVVTELQSLDFAVDSARAAAGDSLQVPVPNTDSIRAQVERQLERVDSIRSSSRRFADSIRAEARRQMAEQANPE